MIMVIFEVQIKPGKQQQYLQWAEKLKSEVQQIPGFVEIQRFQTLAQGQTLLSVSYWQDEQSVLQWKQHNLHQQAQQQGKSELFASYKIRISHVFREYQYESE